MVVSFGVEDLVVDSRLSLIVATLLLVALWGCGTFTFLQGKKLPPGKLGLPFIGDSIPFFIAHRQNKIPQWVGKKIKEYGPIFKTSLMGTKVIVITGEAGNRFIFSGSKNEIVSNQTTSAAAIIGKHSLFELDPSRHKLVRAAMTSFLKPESIQRYAHQMDSLIQQQFLNELDGKSVVHIVPLVKKITFKVTCSLLFGLGQGKEKDAFFDDFIVALNGVWSAPLNIPGTTFWKAMKARGRITKLFKDLMAQRTRGLESGEVNPQEDIISCLISLRDEQGKYLLVDEVIDNLIGLMLGSHDTIAILLSLLIQKLSRDVKIYNKVLQEQEKVLKLSGGKLGWGEVQMMKYTWCVAQEVMRINPPVLGNFKRASTHIKFGGFNIPKGWKVLWFASGTHMNKDIFKDPEKFDPSRFESQLKSFPPYTYLAFGAGPKICPGIDFARNEVLMIIHHLVTKYKWSEVVADEPLICNPFPYPAMGLPINIHHKEHCIA